MFSGEIFELVGGSYEGEVSTSSASSARVVMARDVLLVVLGMDNNSLNTAGCVTGAV